MEVRQGKGHARDCRHADRPCDQGRALDPERERQGGREQRTERKHGEQEPARIRLREDALVEDAEEHAEQRAQTLQKTEERERDEREGEATPHGGRAGAVAGAISGQPPPCRNRPPPRPRASRTGPRPRRDSGSAARP